MKALRIFVALILSVPCALAQKEKPLPKDLPPYGPEKPLQAPSVKTAKLENGLSVWLVSEGGFPQVAFTVAVRGGLAADPSELPGISELLASTLDQGTKSRSARQIAEEMQAAGGDIGTRAEKDAVVVSTSVLSSKADAALPVLADILQNASFPENEVALAKRNLADTLQQREAEPSFLANRAMAKAIFGSHPYSVIAPTQESLTKATAADLRGVFAKRFRPDQAVFIAVGDFENERMMNLIHENLGNWSAPKEAPADEATLPATSLPHAVFIVARPGSVQTTLAFGALGPVRSAPDYEAAEVANAIYGGMFSSRLIVNIREDKGYTYSPFARLQTFRRAGVVQTRADVRNAVTAPTFNEMVYELNRMATTDPTEEELNSARRFLVGTEAIQLQSRGAVAGELANLWIDSLPPEEIGIYGEKVSKTTAADVDAAAKNYFPASRAVVVAVGEEKVVREALAPFGLNIQLAP